MIPTLKTKVKYNKLSPRCYNGQRASCRKRQEQREHARQQGGQGRKTDKEEEGREEGSEWSSFNYKVHNKNNNSDDCKQTNT